MTQALQKLMTFEEFAKWKPEGEYQMNKFRDDDRIKSPTFPELTLTAQQIFQAGSV